MNDPKALKPMPAPLPGTLAELMKDRKVAPDRTLNDHVEDAYKALYEDTEFNRLLYAVWDEQAVEGSLSADNHEAARMMRAWAPADSPLRKEKLATIMKALGVVLRRYGKSRKERRMMLGGEVVPGDNGE